jgi:hypothetical protein
MNLKDEQENMRYRQFFNNAKKAIASVTPRKTRSYIPKGRKISGKNFWTYLIQGETTGLVKIGRSRNVVKRFNFLAHYSPDKLKLVGVIVGDYEKHLHAVLSSLRLHGEWFKPEVLGLVSSKFTVLSGDDFFPRG